MADLTRRTSPRGLAATAIVLGVVVLGGGGAWLAWDAREDQVATDAEPTGWQVRQDLASLLEETAEVLGIETTVRAADDQELVCARSRGGEGVMFFVPGFDGPVLDDLDAGLAAVRALWQERGLTVADRGIGEASGIVGTDELGSAVTLLSGPGGTFAQGETFCATRSGRPADADDE